MELKKDIREFKYIEQVPSFELKNILAKEGELYDAITEVVQYSFEMNIEVVFWIGFEKVRIYPSDTPERVYGEYVDRFFGEGYQRKILA